jgi:hypothetical protein
MGAAELILPDDESAYSKSARVDRGSDEIAKYRKKHKKRGLRNDNVAMNLGIYDEDLYNYLCQGIVQNLNIEIGKRNLYMSHVAYFAEIEPSTLYKTLSGQVEISMKTFLKVCMVLQVSPGEMFPFDMTQYKTNGQRFDEITKTLDVASINYLLDMAAHLANLQSKQR